MIKNRKSAFILLLLMIQLVLIFIIKRGFLYGSTVDWISQHSVIPEYFRNQFYTTKHLFPTFAFHLGGGQNIFNFAYYGLFSPIILVSYLLPMVPMTTYIAYSTILITLCSTILLYIWLCNHFSYKIAFISCLFFILASPFIYHSHKHIMFINYFPFLILGFVGVERLLEVNKKGLLICSIILLIMTSFIFSIPSIIAITLYGIFYFLEKEEQPSICLFIKKGWCFFLCIACAILCTGFFLLPIFHSIINGRSQLQSTFSLTQLLFPDLNLSNALYSAYGIGVTYIGIVSCIGLFFLKKNSFRFLIIALSFLYFIPIFMYGLNDGLYIRGKSFIPILPLIIFLLASFLSSCSTIFSYWKAFIKVIIVVSIILFIFFPKWISMIFLVDIIIVCFSCYFFYKKKQIKVLIFPSLCFASILFFCINFSDKLQTTSANEELNHPDKIALIEEICKLDNSLYRFQDFTNTACTVNKIYNNNFLKNTIYSSMYNSDYLNFFNDIFFQSQSARNQITVADCNNILLSTFMGNKYIITTSTAPTNYVLVDKKGIYKLYKNEMVFPLGFASSNLIDYNYFHSLDKLSKTLAFFQGIVVEKPIKYITNLNQYDITSIDMILPFSKENETDYYVNLSNDITYTPTIVPNHKNSVYLLDMTIDPILNNDVQITANETTNLLDITDNLYFNKNYNFNFILSNSFEKNTIPITFSKGEYRILNFKAYELNTSILSNARMKLDAFYPTKDFRNSSHIKGSIHVTNDGYFTMTIPYDSGFRAKVDGQWVNVEKVNTAFIGFPISKGSHIIEIYYTPPLLKEGICCTIIGIFSTSMLLTVKKKYFFFSYKRTGKNHH